MCILNKNCKQFLQYWKQLCSQKELIDYCSGKLAEYKLPTRVEFRESLPKSAVGKILKRVLKDEEITKSLMNGKNNEVLQEKKRDLYAQYA